MNAEIIAVGTELLMGQISNTNAQYISGNLAQTGINVYYHSVVGDNPQRLKQSLKLSLGRSDIIILTGGLGPTKDDLTKETVAEVLGLKLVLHKDILENMKKFFDRLNRTMSINNEKQAYLPENCIVINNKNGTAPGCIIETDSKTLIILPGPPTEMKPMFDETVIPYLSEKSDFLIVSRFIKIFGIGESTMEEKIMDIIEKQTNPTIAPYAKPGEVTLRITARCKKAEDASKLLNPVIENIKKRLSDKVYSTDNETLEEVVAKYLIKSKLTVSIAESCTGGLISGRLTSIQGISKVFERGIVSYSNRSKMENLNVNQKTIEIHGAVSKETAVEMAKGIRNISGTDLGLAVTGIAGPGGGTDEKPVGSVFIAVSDINDEECEKLSLWGDRERIRNVAVLHSLDLLRRRILKNTGG